MVGSGFTCESAEINSVGIGFLLRDGAWRRRFDDET
jgi:hypothetical protein